MLQSIAKGILTVVFAWVLAVIVDRVMTSLVLSVRSAFRKLRKQPAPAA